MAAQAREPDHLFWIGVFAVAIFGFLHAVQWSRLTDAGEVWEIVRAE